MSPMKNERGQISIFFSASLIVLISVIAFVINVGLFVKAKINLQNATDAAAFAGAAVQSRQLTKIAYLNWEMRNTFKEWMYKYYVIGNLNVPGVDKTSVSSSCSGGPCTTFRMTQAQNVTPTGIVAGEKDHYNFPSTCIHLTNSTNICTRFTVPGLPEFGGLSISGAEEASRTFMDGLIGAKASSCNERSKLNALVATSWAYNVIPIPGETNTLAAQAPAIAMDRQGAWPKAIEIAMRIRNLEKVVNREAVTENVCMGGDDCTTIQTYESQNLLGNERIVKAFYSGYRNLGNHIDNEMKNSFKLKELAPISYTNEQISNASNLLLPTPYSKQYLDLKLMMVNYAVFYNAFLVNATKNTSAGCPVSKMAIPVPGYPLGYYKNPKVVTYYAVKGEADFVGMFNPISNVPIKLRAYAAAKPMGGRIGPMLFREENNLTKSRDDASKLRSVPYFLTFDPVGTPNTQLPDGVVKAGSYGPNVPLPINIDSNQQFWIEDAGDVIGGKSANTAIKFGIPNLVYDYLGGTLDPTKYTKDNSPLHKILPVQEESGDQPIGLFNHEMFLRFRGELTVGAGLTAEVIDSHIRRVKAPTRYEAANYLFPMPNEINTSLKIDSFGIPSSTAKDDPNVPGLKHYSAHLYAPLYKSTNADHEDIIYNNSGEVYTAIINFMKEQETAMKEYIKALNTAAIQTYKTSFSGTAASGGAQQNYLTAAKIISDINIPVVSDPNALDSVDKTQTPGSCHSMAGQFWHFYYGAPGLANSYAGDATCAKSFPILLQEYFSNTDFAPPQYRLEYSYYAPNFADPKQAYGAYVPGPFTGIGMDGTYSTPGNFISGDGELMRRNFYSTKLITLDSIQKGSVGYDLGSGSNFNIQSEGEVLGTSADQDTYPQGGVSNLLDPQSVDEDLENVRH